MKSIFVGIIGIFMTMYLFLFGIDIYRFQTEKNALEHALTQSVQNTLESQYQKGELEAVKELLEADINAAASKHSTVKITVDVWEKQKGFLKVTVEEKVPMLTAKDKKITMEKTAIMERVEIDSPSISVRFLVDGELYKEFVLVKGETCPLPALPSGGYTGWKEHVGNANKVTTIGQVWEDKVFFAIRE